MKNIRNFSIIAHINHGKSTLSDRFIEICNGLNICQIREQILDSMDIERERGITIKAQSVTLEYKAKNNNIYKLNFIDTPGHVDFCYEVSRSLAACEGTLLIIDSSQGVEAQTIANYYNAIEHNLKIIVLLNKIDLPFANPDIVRQEIEEIIEINNIVDILECSAKTGVGIIDILETIISKIPCPEGSIDNKLQALIIDSWFDNYLGIVSLVRIKNGIIKIGDKIKVMSTGVIYRVNKLGIFTPQIKYLNCLSAGEVGFVAAGIKDIYGARVGDTLTNAYNPTDISISGFKKIQPQVYAGIFTNSSCDYIFLREALKKLSLNDASLFFEPETSRSLGFGFRCGFLGMLHMEIIEERLKREYNLDLIITFPTVIYKIIKKNGNILYIDSPSKLPELITISDIQEPIVRANILIPKDYIGDIINLCIQKRGRQIGINYIKNQVLIIYDLPMIEVISNFFNTLKSLTKGYGSLDYKLICYKSSNIVCLDIFLNKNKIDALSSIVHIDNAKRKGKELVEKLKNLIPKQMFEIVVQASINGHIIARANIKSLRKNVLIKCYGSRDITRKKKLLEKQKDGKKRMKNIGLIKIPQEIFFSILKN